LGPFPIGAPKESWLKGIIPAFPKEEKGRKFSLKCPLKFRPWFVA